MTTRLKFLPRWGRRRPAGALPATAYRLDAAPRPTTPPPTPPLAAPAVAAPVPDPVDVLRAATSTALPRLPEDLPWLERITGFVTRGADLLEADLAAHRASHRAAELRGLVQDGECPEEAKQDADLADLRRLVAELGADCARVRALTAPPA